MWIILAKNQTLCQSLATSRLNPYNLPMALNELQQARLKKLDSIKHLGVNPYPAKVQRQQTVAQALEKFGQDVAVAGRLKSIRPHGKITFADLEDVSSKIQLLFSTSLKAEAGKLLPNLDIGDFVAVQGRIIKTQAGEITIEVTNLQLIAKALRPLPSEWFGLKDIEIKLRKRYLDLMLNPEVREIFIKKAKFWRSVRQFLESEGFIEVETPALEPIPGGADARPFITHHNALDRDFYLRISLELYQKRLLVGGFEKVYEIGKIFRNEGVDAEHLQDYLQMEFYWAYADYNDLMAFTQRMLQQVVSDTTGSLKTIFQTHEINWSGLWPKIDYGQVFKEATGMDIDQNPTLDQLLAFAKKSNIPIEGNASLGRVIDTIFKKLIRPKIIQPAFLINHPVAVSPLAKRMETNSNRVERVQLLVAGSEATNGFSELNDPQDQLSRFKEQQTMLEKGDEEAQRLDMDYIEAMEYGMPPAAGFGMSERLFAILMDKPIREIVLFPPMKQE